MGVDVCSSPLILSSTFSNKVEGDRRRFLLKGGVRLGYVDEDRLVVTKNVCGKVNWDSHHAEFVSQASYVLTALFHGNEF